jgi:hypothetical protein
MRYFLKLLLLNFVSSANFFCHSGHDWPADDERFVDKIHEWFWWTDNVTVPVWKLQKRDASLSQHGTGIAQHESRRVSSFQGSSVHP